MYLHNTIRAYTLALLNFFNEISIQYTNSNGDILTVNVPIHYKNVEKSTLINMTEKQILSGNMNVIPRAYLELTSLSKDADRQTPKFNKISRFRNGEKQEFAYQSVPYTFEYNVVILCRGMNEVAQLIEEVCPKFNSNISIDIYDRKNIEEPYRAPIQLTSVDFEIDEFEELSSNLARLTFGLTLYGFLHEPIQEYAQVLKYNVNLYTPDARETELFRVDDDFVQPDYEFMTNGNDLANNVDRTGSKNESDFSKLKISDLRITALRHSVIDDNNCKVSVEYSCSSKPQIDFKILTQSDDVKIEVDEDDINSVYIFGIKGAKFTVQARLKDGECIKCIQQTYRL